MPVYLILIIATAGAPIQHAYEFKDWASCSKAVDQVQAAYKDKTQKPLVFCAPTAEPFNPGKVAPVAPSGVKLTPRRGMA